MLPKDAVPIPGFPGYHVTPEGSVWSCVRRGRTMFAPVSKFASARLRNPWRHHRGYLRYDFFVDGKKYGGVGLHRIMLLAFVGPPPPRGVARHLDGDPSNNALTNLSWGSFQDNSNDRIRHGNNYAGSDHHFAKLTPDTVREARRIRKETGLSYDKIAKHFNVAKSTIQSAIKHATWKDVL